MRTLPLVLLAVAALVAPTAALAGGSATPTARYFVITGLVLGDQKAEASGKLAIDGSQLSASVGCNLIGGKVSVDGNTITISDPLAMTEMACPGTNGDLESMLLKVLEHGPFTIGAGDWSGNGARILAEELPAGNPDPNATAPAPDDPVGSSPGPTIIDPGFSCPPYPFQSGDPGVINGTVEPDGGPTSGGGSGPTSTGMTEPGATSTAGEEPPAPPVAPEPGQTLDVGQTEPAPSPVIVEPAIPMATIEPAPSAIAVPDPGTVTDPGASYDPDPGFNGSPLPVDPCAERMYAVDQGGGAGGVGLYPPKADAAEHAASTSNPNAPIVALGLVLLVVAAFAVGTFRRARGATADEHGERREPG